MAEFWLNLRFLFIFPGFWLVAWIFTYWRAGIFSRLYAKLVRNGVMSPWFFPFYEFLRNVVFPHWLIWWPQVPRQVPGSKHLWMFVCVGFAYFWQWLAVVAAAVARGVQVYAWDRFNFLDPTPLIAGGWWSWALALLWWAGWTLACNVLVVWLLRIREDLSEQLEAGIRKYYSMKDDVFRVEKIGDKVYRIFMESSFVNIEKFEGVKEQISTASGVSIIHFREGESRKEIDIVVGEAPVKKTDDGRVADVDINYLLAQASETEYKIVLGHNGNEPVYWLQKFLAHIAFFGKTGAGKSNAVRWVFFRMAEMVPGCLFCIVDPEKHGNDYNRFPYAPEDLASAGVTPLNWEEKIKTVPARRNVLMVTDREAYVRFVDFLDDEVSRRADIFNRCGVSNYEEYVKHFGSPENKHGIFRIFILLEEITVISSIQRMRINGQLLGDVYTRFEGLLMKARTYGINIGLVSQVASMDVVGRSRRQSMSIIFKGESKEHGFLFGIEQKGRWGTGVAMYQLTEEANAMAPLAFPEVTQEMVAEALSIAEAGLPPAILTAFDDLRAQFYGKAEAVDYVAQGYLAARKMHKSLAEVA